jgi:hypothetical protein
VYRGIVAGSVSESRLAVSISLSKGARAFKDDEYNEPSNSQVDQAMLRRKKQIL